MTAPRSAFRVPFIALPLLAVLCLSRPSAAAEPPTTTLAQDGRAPLAVTVGVDASDAARAAADELAAYLGKISGATFGVETGDGHAGIVVGKPADFPKLPFAVAFGAGPFEREQYVLRSQAGGLWLLGATDLAVSHAVWDLLHRLGHRQFFPGETWEVVPRTPNLSVAVDVRAAPSFNARRIWYNWGLWGYNDGPYHNWCRRNRMAKGFDLESGHSYESIVAANRAEFDAHPEYFALIDGRRNTAGGDLKFCVSNPGLRKLVVEHAQREFRANPTRDSISMDPSDGGGWCECDECAKLGGVSTRVVTLANEVAVGVNELGLGPKYVGMYAYNRHSDPPAVRVDPHVIPSATTAFIGGGLSFDQVVSGWQKQGATMGVYDYLSVVDWDWNLPRGGSGSRPAGVAGLLKHIHGMGVRFYDAESGDCWGPCGLGYYTASRALWNVDQADQIDAITADFLDKAFGTAQEPMAEFYRLISFDDARRPPSDLIGRMYRQLDAARKATDDPKVLARLDDLTLYTRYAELYSGHAAGTVPVETVARFAYRIRKTMMVHSYGLWCRLVGQGAALTDGHTWKDDRPFPPEEIASILAEGIKNNVPVDPGFETVAFGTDLVPAAAKLQLPAVEPGRFPETPQNQQRYSVWLPKAGGVDLKITVQKVWALRSPEVRLYSPQEVSLDPVAVDSSYAPDGKTAAVHLASPHAGLHRVETIDGGDYTRIEWPDGVPVTVESGIDTPNVTNHFGGGWSLYFYVPKGTKSVGGWASRIANWAPRTSGKLLDADGTERLDFAAVEEGWFNVPVPPGQDGRLWKFENSQGQRLLMTVPPYFARRAEELLLPSAVVEADAVK